MSDAWFKREDRRKVTFGMGENETEIDFVLIRKEHRRFLRNVRVISREFHHALVVADIYKKKNAKYLE